MKRVPHITILTISTTSCIFSFSFLEMEWSNEQTLLFIEQYEKMPVLWDFKHPEHKNGEVERHIGGAAKKLRQQHSNCGT